MSLTSPVDIEARWRPLTAAQAVVAPQLLDDAEALVRLRIPDLDAKIADASFSALVRMVIVRIVVRALRNPDGHQSTRVTDYTVTWPQPARNGLYLTEEDLGELGIPAGAWSIRPHYEPGWPVEETT